MTFGRPAMISRVSSEVVPLPLTVDDEFISSKTTSDPSQPGDQPSMMWFYAKTLELYEIMNDVLLNLYKPVFDDHTDEPHDFYLNCVLSEGERTIFDLDRSLTRWTRGLPRHLGAESSIPQSNPILFRQRIVLHARCVRNHNHLGCLNFRTDLICRFLHVRTLLFRPTLSRYCAVRDNTTSHSLISIADSFPHRVALQCSIICVRVAQESIDLIHSNVPADGTGGPLPAWWYNILCMFSLIPSSNAHL